MRKQTVKKIREVYNTLPDQVKNNSVDKVRSHKWNTISMVPVNHEKRMRRIYHKLRMKGVIDYYNLLTLRYANKMGDKNKKV